LKVVLKEERKVLEVIKNIKGDLFIDIGALWGEYAINLADNFKEVWAFEPAEDSRRILEENIKKYGKKNIRIFAYALSDKRGESQLWRHEEGIMGMTGIKREYSYKNRIQVLKKLLGTVEVRTLDELVKGRKVDLIKIDTEGSEKEILEGGKETLKNTKRIIIEIHNYRKENINYFLNLLKSLGFEMREIGTKRFIGVRKNE